MRSSLDLRSCEPDSFSEALEWHPWFVWLMVPVLVMWVFIAWWERNPNSIPRFYRSPWSLAIIRRGMGLVMVVFSSAFTAVLFTNFGFRLSCGSAWWWARQVFLGIVLVSSIVGVSVFLFSRPRFLIPPDCRPEKLSSKYRRWSTDNGRRKPRP